MTKRQPRRDPHPAEDGTPWHLRMDLTHGEMRDLTPKQNRERTNARKRRLYAADLDKSRKASREKGARLYKADPEKVRVRSRKRNLNRDPRHRKAEHLKDKYSLPLEVYEWAIVKQLNLCAICGEPETAERNGKVRALAVDHCHDTGIVRGFLCSACNLALGKLRDNPALLRAAADYLDAHNRHTLYSAQIAKRLSIPTT